MATSVRFWKEGQRFLPIFPQVCVVKGSNHCRTSVRRLCRQARQNHARIGDGKVGTSTVPGRLFPGPGRLTDRGGYQGNICRPLLQLNTTTHIRSICTSSLCSSQKSSLDPVTPSDPFQLVSTEMSTLYDDIKKELTTYGSVLRYMSHYYFDGQGKAFRPMVVLLMSRACNFHNGAAENSLALSSQRRISMIAEMIHTASLVHDDVIDEADTRRGKACVSNLHGQRKAILTGDYILTISSMALAAIGNKDVVILLSQVIEDLVRGEFMQLGTKEDEDERFAHYLKKTFKKTASLLAYSCRAVAVLSGSSKDVQEVAYQYGKNLGIAFQLVDDMLDFMSTEELMGKPTAADLKLGLATAPVLFAAEKYPELNAMIMRRFSEPGDVELAREAVTKTDSLQQSRILAEQYCREAVRQIQQLAPSPEREALVTLTQKVLNRKK
ncbi:all trans-polyprenyl-diphosphate synthase PDSS1-like isoform X1 [Branchiostoma floridae x Branchiostoma belcheri]